MHAGFCGVVSCRAVYCESTLRRSPGREGTWPSDPRKMVVAELSEHGRSHCDPLEK
jgi:hypothetical protein